MVGAVIDVRFVHGDHILPSTNTYQQNQPVHQCASIAVQQRLNTPIMHNLDCITQPRWVWRWTPRVMWEYRTLDWGRWIWQWR